MWWKKKKGKRNASHLTRWLKSWCFELLFAFPWRSDLYITGQGGVRGVGWGGVGRRGFMRQPDILRNGNVRYLTEVFRAGSPGFIEFCGLCQGILRPWSDSIQTLSWCSLRWSVWHFDTASIGFVAFQPLACQSIWGEMPESKFSISNNDW